MKSKLFWTYFYLRLQTYVSAISAGFLLAMACLFAQVPILAGTYAFCGILIAARGVACVWSRAGLEGGGRSAKIGAIVLSALGCVSILFFLAVPSLVQAIRSLEDVGNLTELLPDCPVCHEPLHRERQMGKTQLCGCGWFAPIRELRYLHQAPSRRGRRWKRFAYGPAAVFVAVVVGAAVTKQLAMPSAEESESAALEKKAPQEKAQAQVARKAVATKTAEKQIERTPSEWYQRGAECNSEHNFKCAREAFSAIVKMNPRDTTALANLGFAEYRLGHHAVAAKILKAVNESGNPTYDTLAYYGMSLEAMGQFDGALKAYIQTLQVYDRLVDIRQKAIAILIQNNRLEQASDLINAYNFKYPDGKGYFSAQEQLIRERKREVSRQPEEPTATTI